MSVARKNFPPVSSAIFFSVSSSTSTLRHRQALVAEGVGDGHRRFAAHAGADGVNLDAQRLRGLRGGFGHDLAGVVLAVGEEHDDFRFAGLIAQAIDARGERGADGGAVFHGADLHAIEILLEPVVIERERADEIRRAGKTDEADAVVRPRVDELRDDGFHDVEPAWRAGRSSLKSSASIEPEQSMARIMSTPLASTVVVLRPNCGRASADDEQRERERESAARASDPRGCAFRARPGARCRRWNISRPRPARAVPRKSASSGSKREQPEEGEDRGNESWQLASRRSTATELRRARAEVAGLSCGLRVCRSR